jgi:hypothetical protein
LCLQHLGDRMHALRGAHSTSATPSCLPHRCQHCRTTTTTTAPPPLPPRPQVDYQDTQLDFGPPFRRVTMNDLVQELMGVDVLGFGSDLEGAKAAARQALEAVEADTRRCGPSRRLLCHV